MAGLFDDLIPEENNASGSSGLFDDLIPDQAEERKEMNTGFSDALRNPLGAAADWMFPSLKEKREQLKKEGKIDEEGKPVVEEGSVASYIPDLPSPDYLTADVAGGTYNAARGVGEFGANVADLATGSNLTETFNDNVPRYESDTAGGQFVSDATQMMVPGGIAGKAAMGAVKGANLVVRGGAAIAGSGAAMAATGKPTDDGLLAGDNSLTGWSPASKLGLEKGGSEAQDAAYQRINMLVDNMVTDMVGGAAIATGMGIKKALGSIVWDRIKLLTSQPTRDTRVVTEVLQRLVDLPPNASEQQVKQLYGQFLEEANKNKSFQNVIRARLTPEQFDRLPAELKEKIAFDQDTMSVFERVFQGTDNKQGIAETRSMRAGVERQPGNAPKTQEATARPIAAAEDSLNTAYKTAGGEEAVEQTGRALQGMAKEEANVLKPELDLLTEQRDATVDMVKNAVAKDPVFGRKLQELGNDVNIDVSNLKNATDDEIRKTVTQAIRTKQEELKGVMEKAAKSGATIDPKKLLEATKGMKLGEISGDLRKAFGKDASFEKLYPRVPEITSEISRLRRQPGADAADAAKALIRVKELIQKPDGTAEQKKIVADSLKFYQDKWAKYFDGGPLGDFYDTFRSEQRTLGSFPSEPLDAGKATEFKIGTDRAIDQSVGNRHGAEQMRELLGETKQEGLLADRYGAEALADVQARINAGTFKPEDMMDVVNNMTKNNPIISGSPELKKSLDDIVTKIRNGTADINVLNENIAQVSKDLAQAQRDTYKAKFAEFFSSAKAPGRGAEKITANPNIQGSFTDLFTGNKGQNLERIRQLKSQIDATGDEGLKKGFEAAYIDTVKERLLSATQGNTGGSNVKTGFDKTAKDQVMKYGEAVFGNDPEKAKFFKAMVDEAQKAMGMKSAFKTDVTGTGNIADNAMKGVQFIITHIFGKLDPKGTAMSTTAKAGIELADMGKMYDRVDVLFSNLDEFYKVGMKYANSKSPLPAKDRWLLYTLGLQAGLKETPDAVMNGLNAVGNIFKGTDEQTNEVFNQPSKISNEQEEETEEEE